MSAACDLYPIALAHQTLSAAAPNSVLPDILNGQGPGQFGWLSWSGSPNTPTLLQSLTPPGNAQTYVNPDDPADHQLGIGDWVRAKPGLSNSRHIRNALDALLGQELVVPAWDATRGHGEKAAYHVSAFARVVLLSYDLPGGNRISARFLGFTSCAEPNEAPRVDAGPDRTLVEPGHLTLAGQVTDDGQPHGQLDILWSLVAGPAAVQFVDPQDPATSVEFVEPGTYTLRLTASDGELGASDDVTITVSQPNNPPVAFAEEVSTAEDNPVSILLRATDPDLDALAFAVTTPPAHGQLVGTAPHLRYEPAADYNGPDEFTFEVSDGSLTASAAVRITIVPVNDAPIADPLSATTAEDTPVDLPLSGADVEGDPLTFELLALPGHGTLEWVDTTPSTDPLPSTPHVVRYTPNPDFFGIDQFTFRVSDGVLTSPAMTVPLTIAAVNDPPVVHVASHRLATAGQITELTGWVSDDGTPSGQIHAGWSQADGPAPVAIENPSATNTTATFPVAGTYHLDLTGSDGELTVSATTSWIVLDPQQNQPPRVDAGPDLVLGRANTLLLEGTVSDDPQPADSTSPLTITWTCTEGPGEVHFALPHQPRTSATFSQPGRYRLQLAARDHEFTATDEAVVNVYLGNLPPVVDAGPDVTLTIPQPTRLRTDVHQPIDAHLSLSRSLLAVDHWNAAIGQPGLDGMVGNNCLAGGGTNVFAAGNFCTAGDIEARSSARWDGQSWHALFDPRPLWLPTILGTHINYVVHECHGADFCTENLDAIAARGTEAYVAGDLKELDTVSDGYWDMTAHWTGSQWESWVFKNYGNHARVITTTPDRIYIGGFFTFQPTNASALSFPDLPWAYGVAAWDHDGWHTLNQGIVDLRDYPLPNDPQRNASHAIVTCLAVSPNGDVFAGGQFVMPTPLGPARHIARWNGTDWLPLGEGLTGNGVNFVAMSLALDAAGQLYVGGNFTHAGGAAAKNVARWDGNSWHPLGPGADNTVGALAVHGGHLYAGGSFYGNGDRTTFRVARWDGLLWSPLGTRTDFGVRGTVNSLLADASGIYVAGALSRAGSTPVNNIALWEFAIPADESLELRGSVTDDGLPADAALLLEWTQISGPAAATFSAPQLAATSVRFPATGTYVLRLTASDSDLTAFDEVVVQVQGNEPPTVDAGSDQAIGFGESLTLIGSVLDDGLPAETDVHCLWSLVHGPADVNFTQPNSPQSSVTFPGEGVYVLRLAANDGQFSAADDLTITVLPRNQEPYPHPGYTLYNQIVGVPSQLCGQILDDDRPNGETFHCWTLASGPGDVLFSDATALDSWVTFTTPGTHLLRLVVNDGQLTARADVLAVVFSGDAPPPLLTNLAPIVDAGPDARVPVSTALTLNGTATDDGQPAGSPLHARWLALDGPSRVHFVNPNAPATHAQFHIPGLYTLQLAVTDSQRCAVDQLQVEVYSPTNQPPLVDAGPDISVTRPAPAVLTGFCQDDGLPAGWPMTTTWSKVSGPGDVAFQPGNDTPVVRATFTAPGTYVLRLTALDSQAQTADDVAVTVLDGVNQPPTVDAGPDLTVAISTTATLNGTVRDDGLPNGTVRHWWTPLSGPGEVSLTSLNGLWHAHFSAPGDYQLELTATDGLTTTRDQCAVHVLEANAPPVATILSPEADAAVTQPTPVVGTVNSPILAGWQVAYRWRAADSSADASADDEPVGATWRTLATGTDNVDQMPLATFDPTLLPNGIYDLALSTVDLAGSSSFTRITVIVDGRAKIGACRLSCDDLTLPIAGLPIRIRRSYDSTAVSLNGDFGHGWALDLANVRLQKNGPLGEGWEQHHLGVWYALTPTRAHRVTVTLPGDRSLQFEARPEPASQFGYPIEWAGLAFTNLPGTRAQLAIDGPADALVDGYSGLAALLDLETFHLFDPHSFRLTTPEGTILFLDEERGLRAITDPRGDTLTFTTNGITHSRGLSVVFDRDASGRIHEIRDPAGRRLAYEYDTQGNLAAAIDPDDRRTQYTYDSDHRLLTVIDPRGVVILRNDYDSAGRLHQQTDALGHNTSWVHDLAARRETTIDRLGHVTHWEYDDRGNITRVTDPLGSVSTFAYDSNDQLLAASRSADGQERTLRFAYDPEGHLASYTDALDHTTLLTYGALGRLDSVTTPLGHTRNCQYDPQGNLVATTDATGANTAFGYTQGFLSSITNALGFVTQFATDAAGRLLRHTDPLGHSTDYVRDDRGLVVTELNERTHPDGAVETLATHWHYDAAGHPTAITLPDLTHYTASLDPNGQTESWRDPLDRESRVTRDALGHIVRLIAPDGSEQGYTWDAADRCVAHTNQLGHVTRFAYDPLGHLTQIESPDGSTVSFDYDGFGQLIRRTDARGHSTCYGYDAAGRLVAVTNALHAVTRCQYDADGNLAALTNPLGHTTTFTYDAADRLVHCLLPDGSCQSWTYDAAGQLAAHTDPNGLVTAYGYDPAGRLAAVTNAAGFVTRYTYDQTSNLTSVTDPNLSTTYLDWDPVGRLLQRTLPGGQSESFGYDPAGQLVHHTDANGATNSFAYDLCGRLLAHFPDPRLGEPAAQFEYDARGRLLTRHDAAGTTTWQYDSADRLRTQTLQITGLPQSLSLAFDYDPAGHLTRLLSSTPGGTDVSYAYDALGQLIGIEAPGFGHIACDYDAAGNLSALALPNGVTSRLTHDPLRRLLRLETSNPGGAIADFSYALDAAGRRTDVLETLVIQDQPSCIQRHYDYDLAGRLIRESVASPLATLLAEYTYDPAGNRLALTQHRDGVATRTETAYNANHQSLALTHDANGNPVAGLSPLGAPFADAYDSRNRLLQRATTRDGQPFALDLLHDHAGHRLAAILTTNGQSLARVRLVADLNPSGLPQVLEEFRVASDGQLLLERAFLPGRGILAQRRFGDGAETVDYLGTDALGTVRHLTDATGTLREFYDFDAFGNLLSGATCGSLADSPWLALTEWPLRAAFPAPDPTAPALAPGSAHLFAGQWWEPDLGSYFFRARDYDPGNGRFRTRDPFDGFLDEPVSQHPYLYARNDPVNHLDPSGYYDLASVSLGLAVGRTLHEMYNSSVVSAGFAIMDTIEGVAQGKSDEEILLDYEMGAITGAAIGMALSKVIPIAARALSTELSVPSARQLSADLRAWLDGHILHAREIVRGLRAPLASPISEIKSYGVSFFGEGIMNAVNKPNSTLGLPGKTHYFMPLEDAAGIRTVADAARCSGMAPSVAQAYAEGKPVYGLVFPTTGMHTRLPTTADAAGWPHFLEGGRTALLTSQGPEAAYLLNPTRELVISGGAPMPTGSVLFILNSDGQWIPIRKW